MTEDAIYAALMDIQREQGRQSATLETIDGRLDKGDTRMGRIETKLDARPCISQRGPCPTQQVTLPDSQSAQDAAIGQAVRWSVGKAWTAMPHVYRTIIVLFGGATLGGISWPGIKAAILSILARL